MIGPDEQVYCAQGAAFRAGAFSALREIGAEYVEEPTLQPYPSPLRWLWAALVGIALPISPLAWQVVGACFMGPVAWLLTHSAVAAMWAATSPLVLTLCRRRLQDVPVALLTLLSVFAAQQHSVVWAAAALFALLSAKESALLAVPAIAAAWLVSGGDAVPMAVALAAAVSAWAGCLLMIFGRTAVAMLRTAAASHSTEYSAEHQAGAPHRLLVDLVMVSPCAVMFAVLGASREPALAAALVILLALHAVAPIRNVRFVLAADILLRAIGAAAMSYPLIELPAVLAVDTYIAWRIRHVYDPVTQALASELGMPAVSANK